MIETEIRAFPRSSLNQVYHGENPLLKPKSLIPFMFFLVFFKVTWLICIITLKNLDFLRGSIHRETEFSFSVVSASLLLLEAKKDT